MPFYVVNGLRVHIKMGGRGRAPAPCAASVGIGEQQRQCCDISAYLCDWPLPDGKLCNAALCEAHAHQVARNRHFCPKHLAEQRRTQPELGLFTSLEDQPCTPD